MLGVCLAMLLLVMVLMGILGGLAAYGEKKVATEPGTILKISLDAPVTERASGNPSDMLDLLLSGSTSAMGLNDVLSCIKKAKTDDHIRGIYLKMSSIDMGFATLEEIRNALLDFKSSGKFVLAYGESFSGGMYYLASAADKVYLAPMGDISWKGLRAQVVFYKGLFEKLGVEVQVVRHGKFKSAVEPYLLDKMSPENREQYARLLDNMWAHLLHRVSETRGIPTDSLDVWADQLAVYDDVDALEKGMVDGLLYPDQMQDTLMKAVSVIQEKDLRWMDMEAYKSVPDPLLKKLEKNKIAVVYAFGDVVMGKGGDGQVSSRGVSEALRDARKDSTIKAIVFRINSPGGSVLAAEEIWREACLAAEAKPLVASFGDYAASGGYYIATPAAAIVAQPTTLTGSIGVFWLAPMVGKAMKDKLGLSLDVYATNESADAPSLFRPMTPSERETVLKGVEKAYDVFLSHVSDGRSLSKDSVDAIGQGRVWNGMDAKALGLVDTLGGIRDAIELAAVKAGLESYRVTEFPKQKSTMEQLLELFNLEAVMLRGQWGELAGPYQYLRDLAGRRGMQARWEEDLVIY